MPLICVWNSGIISPDEDPTALVRDGATNKRVLVHTDHLVYAEERTLTSGEVYVYAEMSNGEVLYIFEQTLDSINHLQNVGNDPAPPPAP
jgi:hypothetical protein